MAVLDDLEETARRLAYWKSVQTKAEELNPEPDPQMLASRQRFSDLGQIEKEPRLYLESVIEGNDLMPVRYFEMGKLASRPVGRLHVDMGSQKGQGYATGFLVAPGLLLTNEHVLPTAEVAQRAWVTFNAEDGVNGLPLPPCVFSLEPQRVYLSDPKLDFCFVAVAPQASTGQPITNFGYLRLHATTGKITRGEYATIIQHPRGRQKHVAARNNKISVYVYDREAKEQAVADNDYIYYSTDTLPGSSGAPVFSDQWYVVALHRRGVPKTRRSKDGKLVVVRRDRKQAKESDSEDQIHFVANEGVRVSRILNRLKDYETTGSPEEKATAGQLVKMIQATVADELSGPFSVPTASVNRLGSTRGGQFDEFGLEITRRPVDVFANAPGYDSEFLGIAVRLPKLSAGLEAAAARRRDAPDSYLLPFKHFSTVMHAQRRLPIYAAVNIDGKKMDDVDKPKRPGWSYDPRIDEAHQPDDTIFSSMVQRGHMAAREFVFWGNEDEALEADIHSFTLTNVCPQIGRFNGSLEWYKLERLIVKTAKTKSQKVSCFMGPVFAADDPYYDDLRGPGSSAEFDTGIRMPRSFWYLLVWNNDGALTHRCFLLDQGDDIDAAGALEFDFEAPATVREVSLAQLQRKAKLTFEDLAAP